MRKKISIQNVERSMRGENPNHGDIVLAEVEGR